MKRTRTIRKMTMLRFILAAWEGGVWWEWLVVVEGLGCAAGVRLCGVLVRVVGARQRSVGSSAVVKCGALRGICDAVELRVRGSESSVFCEMINQILN